MNYTGYFKDNEGNKYYSGIVESGSNSNGSWVKFSDGTMICTLNIRVTNQAIDNAYGSLYQATRVWTFPVPFVTDPTVSCSKFQWGSGAGWGAVQSASATYATLRGIDIAKRLEGTTVDISAIAIGMWK